MTLEQHNARGEPRTRSTGAAAVALLQSMRPRQWSKNLIVFAALIFDMKLDDPSRVLVAVVAFRQLLPRK